MAYIKATATVNGRRIEIEQSSDQATVDAAMRGFFEQLGAAIAPSVTVRTVQVKGSKRKRKAKNR